MIVLGISCYFHDSAAALVCDGQLAAAAEEERFTRRKHDSGFPTQAVEYCLRAAGVTIEQVDHVVYYEKPLVKFSRILETILESWPWTFRQWTLAAPLWLGKRLQIAKDFTQRLGGDVDLLFCQHHLSHAASAFLVSPFERAAVISADGVGEWTTTAWGVGEGIDVHFEKEIRFPHSVGLLFSAITAYLGFQVNDAEWKVMGLAPYGEPRFMKQFREIVDLHDDGGFRLNLKYFAHPWSTRRSFSRRWEKLFGEPQRKEECELSDFHRDIAHSGQKVVEQIMVNMARCVRKETGLKDVCLAGGVGLNSVANWRIAQECGFDRIFIQPAAGDSGGALGAAFYVYNTVLRRPREFVMDHACFGPEFSNEQILAMLRQNGARYTLMSDASSLIAEAARMIAEGKVIGWFQGRMEFGPRALGARSLLADPRDARMKDVINAKVKFRESFRPFAPAVLREHVHEYFETPADMDLPFMLLVPRVRPEKRGVIPAVTHQDGTGRVQTVTPQQGRYYEVIREFGRITGVPIVINTSFNVRGEPIVCTPQDAYNTFVRTGIDALVIGDFVVIDKPDSVDFQAGMRRSVELETGLSRGAPATVR